MKNPKPQLPIKPQYRSETIQATSTNAETRTLEVAFSSETPVERFYGTEILDHQTTSIRLQRFQSGGAVLVDHDPLQQIGVIESVTVGSDKIARAQIRFSKNPRAQQEWQDVQDGIRRHISVGYMIHRLEPDVKNPEQYRAMDWEPLEISFVAIPADTTVGVGRDHDFNIYSQLTEQENLTMTDTSTATKATTQDEATAATSLSTSAITITEPTPEQRALNDTNRIAEITALGELFNAHDFAKRAIASGLSVETCRALLQERIKTKPSGVVQTPTGTVDWTAKEAKQYSLLRAINAHISHDWRNAGFEREVSTTLAEQLRREPRGFYMPLDLNVNQQRLQQAKEPGLGGHLVATELLSGSFIDVLRNTSLLPQLGATMLTNLQGDIEIPKQLTSSNFTWVDEDGETTDTDITFGQIGLKPKTITGSIPITRRLLKQSSLDIEFLVRRDLALGVALAIDKAMFTGTGSNNQPRGILNMPDIPRLNYEEGLSFKDIVALETQIDGENALTGQLAYVGHTTMTGLLKTTEISQHTAQFLLQNNSINGYRYVSSNQVPKDVLLFGNFSSIIMGLWGVLDVVPDTAAKAKSGGLVIRVFQDVDMNVRYMQSFAVLEKLG